jgi:NitT/TauT family transport system permease protein
VPTLQAFPELWNWASCRRRLPPAVSAWRRHADRDCDRRTDRHHHGSQPRFRDLSNSAFQFLRMISPLSWMPIAVFVFKAWDDSIIFLMAFASVWPVMFSTAAGLSKVDPAWFKVARNLGASPMQMLTQIILPAISFDIFTGIRLALGVAWVVLVPAELLGVTSGLGYAIKDARETLSYDHLTAMVLTIGIIGYALDTICAC